MSNAMYEASAPVFIHNLKNLSNLLKVAAVDAKGRGIEPAVFLNARLAPDMFPLTGQVQIVTDTAKGCCARLAGVEPPVFADNETSLPELQDRIKRALTFLRGLKAAQFEGSAAKEVVVKTPIGTLTFSGQDYLNGWALPNFYFHYSTAYNILRHNGVLIGKGNFLGPVPGMQMSGRIAKMVPGMVAAKARAKAKAKASKKRA